MLTLKHSKLCTLRALRVLCVFAVKYLFRLNISTITDPKLERFSNGKSTWF